MQKWLIMQVAVPLLGPVVMSFIIVSLWSTNVPEFTPNWSLVLDFAPSAVTFYAVSLCLGTIYANRESNGNAAKLMPFLNLIAFLTSLYFSFIVVWRHMGIVDYTTNTYFVCSVLLISSIFLCARVQLRHL